jgi:uncharacterized membrane protein YeiH
VAVAEVPRVLSDIGPTTLFRVVDVAGVVANGLLGGMVARANRFDPIGFLFLALVSGLGGGILRDLMLDAGRPVALTDPLYLSAVLGAAVVAFLIPLKGPRTRHGLLVLDYLAVGCWSATGAAKALAVGLGWPPAIFLGVVTAVGGGMLRDILINHIPGVFGRSPLYATLSIIGSAELVLFHGFGLVNAGFALAILTCGVLGPIARWRQWTLPIAPEPSGSRRPPAD